MPRSTVNALVKSQSQYWTWCNLIQRFTSKKCFDSLQCLDLSETQCLHLYHSGRAKKIDLNPDLSFCRSLFTFYWRGKSGKDVKTISMIAKNSWNDDFFHPVKTIHRALGQRKLCIGAVVPEKWQIDKWNIKHFKNLVVFFPHNFNVPSFIF